MTSIEIIALSTTMAAWGFSLAWQVTGFVFGVLRTMDRYINSVVIVAIAALALMIWSAIASPDPGLIGAAALQVVILGLSLLSAHDHYRRKRKAAQSAPEAVVPPRAVWLPCHER